MGVKLLICDMEIARSVFVPAICSYYVLILDGVKSTSCLAESEQPAGASPELAGEYDRNYFYPHTGLSIGWRRKTAMTERFVSKYDEPLTSNDLDICQRALDEILTRLKIGKDTEEAQRAAAIIIELYRQGVHQAKQLVELAAGPGGAGNLD